ncbi:MAG: prolipoprotein diacylglyceryl transferase [Opitutaceae bacterium]|jgi:phosphatidylglycerol:prolipoprotein diacylglycerol transferase|nr:prolipoprotein diacylglyceryl transferase [Opitutaceae bacterium]
MTSPVPAHWVHDLSPFLIQFTDTIGIRYYGLAYVAGFVGAWYLLRHYGRRSLTSLRADQAGDFMTALVIGVLVGGRLGYFLFYQPAELWRDPLALLRVWDGGMSSHGGFIGVTMALLWSARSYGLAWRHLADLVASVAPLGLFFGRVANFINGELWGKTSQVPWAVIFPDSAAPGTPTILIEPRHPSQLYSAALEGLLLLALTQYLIWRSAWLRAAPGRIAGCFLIGYAVARIIGEVFREPDAGLIMGMSRGTFYSLFLIFGGLALLVGSPRAQPSAGTSPADDLKQAPKS